MERTSQDTIYSNHTFAFTQYSPNSASATNDDGPARGAAAGGHRILQGNGGGLQMTQEEAFVIYVRDTGS